MIVEKIRIKNIRGIADISLSFDPSITIIIGRNGSGKTTILDSLAIALEPVKNIWPDSEGNIRGSSPTIQLSDQRFGENECKICLSYKLDDKKYHGAPSYVEINSTHPRSETPQFLMDIYSYARKEKTSNELQPLFVYYRQDRGFENNNYVENSTRRQDILDNSLNGNFRAISDLQSWWDKRDAQEARIARDKDIKYRDPQLEAIRKLVKSIDSFESISFDSTLNPEGLYFNKADGSRVHVSKLSTGEISYIILLADLARRLQTTSPKSELSDIPGVVLIDEIELNLHPAWQSKIIESLIGIFKKCQFVITTHSPQILSSLESAHIRILERDENGALFVQTPLNTKGRTSNYLLEGVFGSPDRYPPIDKLIDNFNKAISNKEINIASDLFHRIRKEIERDPPEVLVLRKRLKKLEEEL